MEKLANIVGFIGAGLFLLAYFLLQYGKVTSDDVRYLYLNAAGAMGVIVSLFWFWNLPCFVVESAWLLISIHSLIRRGRKKI